MRNILRVSLQTKILGLVISMLLFVIVTLTAIFAYWEVKQTKSQKGELALQVATTVSFMPSIKDAFTLEDPSLIIQPIAKEVEKEVGAEFVVIGNKNSIRYAHPDAWKIGRKMVGGDNDRALQKGEYYTSEATGTLGPSLRGKAPIRNSEGDIVGIVSVGFLIEDIQAAMYQKLWKISIVAFLILLVGVGWGVLLVRSIRKDTLGLEPKEIASLYRDRSAILYSIKEGIIAIDQDGNISMMNTSAQEMLHIPYDAIDLSIEEVFPNTKMLRVLQSGQQETDQEMLLGDRLVIVNRTPVVEQGEVIGVVASFRDKTEVQQMVQTLTEVRKYSEDLRSQTHEYTNKLYVLSGLLQLGNYQEARELLDEEVTIQQQQNRILFDQIEDETVQAILLGKISFASEKKIDFHVNEETELHALPSHIQPSLLITILGNLLDNAFDAVSQQQKKQVSFFATDIGKEIVLEVQDNGIGIETNQMDRIFHKGFTTSKEKGRGFGLSNVMDAIYHLEGSVEVNNAEEGGTVFSVFIPKQSSTKEVLG
ncbi:ATP-binding protein [Pontibacillus salicampi]|uniref:histidine kinase n=1 Tax=Pontibacillus salicampi TaxID=1449801 RepID=A0ABV6LRL8_9BACI